MSFQSSSERILPPIMTLKPSSPVSHSANNVSQTPVLPPVSCLTLSPITPPPDFTKNHNLHISQSPQSYILPPQNSERTSPRTPSSGHFHFHPDAQPSQQYVDQHRSQFSPTRVPVSTSQQLSHIPPPSHHP